ncbi:Hypothetical predicted protein [Mytilus galloprovincialis]|uniref:Uncharacterized protein n=1 Tax=Mytilus galloprovincialis TaxID=29158 RepID=A0A8B6G809_MYTGA|nr:Hypothetical predicted protein [Mytilus galloprovincialis]
MYEALVACLEAIIYNEGCSWDRKAIADAHGLLSKITDSTTIMCFHAVHNFFGCVRGVSSKVQGSYLDIIEGYKIFGAVKQIIEETRKNEQEFALVYSKTSGMAVKAGLDELTMPCRCARQTHHNNVPSTSDKEYFKRAIYLPYLD